VREHVDIFKENRGAAQTPRTLSPVRAGRLALLKLALFHAAAAAVLGLLAAAA
jgi:hypothetical protein